MSFSAQLGSLLSQEVMRLRRILSSASYGGTFFQKKAFSSNGLVQTNRSLRNVVTRGDCECHAKLATIFAFASHHPALRATLSQ